MTAPGTRSGPPPTIVTASAAWALLAGLLAWAWLGGPGDGGAGGESVDAIRGQLGDGAVATGGESGGIAPILLPVLAVALLVLAAALVLGQRWTVWPLTLAGVGAVLVLASDGRWETLVAMVLLAVALVALLLPRRSRRFLSP